MTSNLIFHKNINKLFNRIFLLLNFEIFFYLFHFIEYNEATFFFLQQKQNIYFISCNFSKFDKPYYQKIKMKKISFNYYLLSLNNFT